MQTQTNETDTKAHGREMDEDLADILTAISVVSKRLAKKLTALSGQGNTEMKGGRAYEQDERTAPFGDRA